MYDSVRYKSRRGRGPRRLSPHAGDPSRFQGFAGAAVHYLSQISEVYESLIRGGLPL
ncbi:uncharacterized protein PHALS_10793 [Plasmopara halstedii]|uniref:Uncharacterized protein n=1 Tax=Plasmopara halstedii TaxID=4781 RepID=A0A0P1AHB9_PLAHL|nr:uncharacterized protein PHALS_10793 [Plasmopara halstedii]CEG40607.1 hypothetical protein PHALS_10793 [Plasmopara halstedii]|eukprot:XP_024576976.1 hypothetical protein PHALS_10793 [Plasmopara halstedii]